MGIPHLLKCRLVAVFMFSSWVDLVLSWQPQHHPKYRNTISEASHIIAQNAAAIILAAVCFTTMPSAAIADTPMSISEQIQGMGLQQPTEDRPQIQIPSSARSNFESKRDSTLVQALVSLSNPQNSRPLGSDFLVVQVFDDDDSLTRLLLGGAKIPVAKIRFPIVVQLGPDNSKVPVEDWNRLVPNIENLWIEASICPEESSSIPCPSNEQHLESKGVSKLLRQLPGLGGDSTSTVIEGGIRVPASLPLK